MYIFGCCVALGIISAIGALAVINDPELDSFAYEETQKGDDLSPAYEYEPPNALGIFVSIVCNVLYIVVCCRVRSHIDKINNNSTDPQLIDQSQKDLEDEKMAWVYLVLGSFSIQLLLGFVFGYWVEVISSFIFFGAYAYCFYYCIEKHEDNIEEWKKLDPRFRMSPNSYF